jgi:ABC-2 type transport system permease protein
MPIHDQGYRRYGGVRLPRGRAWSVIAAAGIRGRLGRRPFLALLFLAWFPFLVRAVQMYAAVNLPQASFLAPTPQMFRQFLEQQAVFVFFITVYCGAGLIANDRRANALQLYLSRPLTRVEYVAGKMAILMAFLLLVTWVPATALLVVQVAFAGSFEFVAANPHLLPAITLYSAVQSTVVASAMLALSSLSTSSRFVGILYAAVVFFSEAVFGVLRFVAGDTSLSWLSVPVALNQIGDAIFGLPLRYDTPWPLSLAMVALLVAVSALVLQRRIRGVEVVT